MEKFTRLGWIVWVIVSTIGNANAGSTAPSTLIHLEQRHLRDLVASCQEDQAFQAAFNAGNQLFDTEFSPDQGGGANVGNGQLFTTIPRADLDGPGQWARHFPSRSTGPNAPSCVACHSSPAEDGASAVTERRDPFHTGNPARYLTRNTTPLFGLGAVQRLAEEMSAKLKSSVRYAKFAACLCGRPYRGHLTAKGVSYGWLTAKPKRAGLYRCRYEMDMSKVEGLSQDLVVRPLQWKGSSGFIRDFNRGAGHNELGMQGVELVGDGVDGDGDGVTDELSVGDVTALAVYNAAQPRPTTRLELSRLKLIPKLTRDEERSIHRGERAFRKAGCASCHLPELHLANPIFSEPSQSAEYRDAVFPAGQDPIARFVDPKFPITFDLTEDQPGNRIVDEYGQVVYKLGSFEKACGGGAVIRLYGDLKRHEMGPALAEAIDEAGTGSSVFLTRPLWGVGSTAPYLHDGRAATLEEAIQAHGGEAAESAAAYAKAAPGARRDLVAFLQNLVLFKIGDRNAKSLR